MRKPKQPKDPKDCTPAEARRVLDRFRTMGVEDEALLPPDEIAAKIASLHRALVVSQSRIAEKEAQIGSRILAKKRDRTTYCEHDKIPPRHITANSEGHKIYVLRAGTNAYKIGYSYPPVSKRISTLEIGSPVPLELVAIAEGTQTLERKLHRYLKFYRTRGEWFELPDRIFWWLLAYLGNLSKPTALRLITNQRSPDYVDRFLRRDKHFETVTAKHLRRKLRRATNQILQGKSRAA